METGRHAIGAYEVIRSLAPSRVGQTQPGSRASIPPGDAALVVRRTHGPQGVFELHLVDPRPRSVVEAREELALYAQLAHPALEPVVDEFDHAGKMALV